MDGNQVFTGMFKDDQEGQKLLLVPGADELMTQFEQKFQTIISSMFEFGLKVCWISFGMDEDGKNVVVQEKESRDHEIEDFWICVKEAKDENTRRAAAIVDEFKAYRTKLFVRYRVDDDDELLSSNFRWKKMWNNKAFLLPSPRSTTKPWPAFGIS